MPIYVYRPARLSLSAEAFQCLLVLLALVLNFGIAAFVVPFWEWWIWTLATVGACAFVVMMFALKW